MNFPAIRTALIVAVLGTLTACDSRTAEQKGKDMATEKIDMVTGIGTALEEKGSAATESVVGGMGKLVKGYEKGVTKSGRTLVSDASVTKAGLQITKAQDATAPAEGEGTGHGLDLYILSEQDAEGKLRVILFDVMDKEIGRTSVQLSRKADEGKYQYIGLDPQIKLGSISKVAFDYKPSAVLVAEKK